MTRLRIGRRTLLGGLAAGTGGLLLAGCDKIVANPTVNGTLRGLGDPLHYRSQRLISGGHALAQEFSASEMSPIFRENGNTLPESSVYQAHAAGGFADWALVVDGLVAQRCRLGTPTDGIVENPWMIGKPGTGRSWPRATFVSLENGNGSFLRP